MNQRTKALDRVSEIFHFKLHRILSQTTSGIFHFPVPELERSYPWQKEVPIEQQTCFSPI